MRQVCISQESELGLVYKCHHEIVTHGIRSCRSEVLVVQPFSLQVRMQGVCVCVCIFREATQLVGSRARAGNLVPSAQARSFLAILFVHLKNPDFSVFLFPPEMKVAYGQVIHTQRGIKFL